MPKTFSQIKHLWYSWRDKGGYTSPKCIRLKVDITKQLAFKLAYNDVTIKHASHYTARTCSWIYSRLVLSCFVQERIFSFIPTYEGPILAPVYP